MIDLSRELSHLMKSGSITATLTPRNSGSVPVNFPKSWINKISLALMLCVLWNSEGVIHWELVRNGRAVDADLYSQRLEWVHEILRRYPGLTSCSRTILDHILEEKPWKNSGIGRNQTVTTLSIHHRSCAFRLPGSLLAWKKFRKHWICWSGYHRILRIKNQALVPLLDNKPLWN